MSLLKIAWRSLQQRTLSSILTGFSMALGVSLVVAVMVIYGVAENHFRRGAQGYNLIVGAKGGKLQLVMNTVYHLSQPVENLPYSFYKQFKTGEFAPYVEVAIPLCMGDSYMGGGQTFRVVGTTPDMFTKINYGQLRDGTPLKYAFQPGGRNFKHENFFEAVIGSVAANVTGLKVGDTFQPSHGIVEEGVEAHEHEPFKIVGILEPTGTPNDRAMFVNMEGFYLLEGHAKAHAEEEPAEKAESAKDAHDHDHADEDHAHEDHEHEKKYTEENDTEEKESAEKAAVEDVEEAASSEDEPAGEEQAAEEPAEKKPAAAAKHEHDEDHAHEEHAHEEHAHKEHAHDAHDHGHGHDHHHHHHHEPLPESQREVTAILITTEDIFTPLIANAVNEGNIGQAVYPSQEIANFFDTWLGGLELILLLFAGMIVAVAGIGVMVSIYNTINERRHEIAVMRALGASQNTVLMIVLLESILLSVLGGLAGILLGHGVIGLFSPYVVQQTGVTINPFHFDLGEWVLIPGLVVLASLVGLVPARAAYKTDVAKALGSTP